MIEQWNELKETIIELRDNDGTATQQEVCQFLFNLMNVLEQKKGKWIDNKGLYQCSVCKHIWSELWWTSICPIDRMNEMMHYCPNCGADMRGEQK